ncbi:hypothetical protein CK203_069298 [Vitis vinifera]|uniref:Uncharacterized protein n=1 Tax=Vitis vinifera TaxID=29760 RepID=A0A438C297_VITVI|nr:hypothetical protein CK203_069298 [Vitis vinifera]
MLQKQEPKTNPETESSALITRGPNADDLDSRKTIGNANQSGGLYFFEDGSELEGQAHSTCFKSLFVAGTKKIMAF